MADAIAWLEKDYDDWKYHSWENSNGLRFTTVIGRSLARSIRNPDNPMSCGPGHDQPMIRIKDDTPLVDEGDVAAVEEIYHCFTCVERGGHRCNDCNAPVPCMTGYYCVPCWTRLDADGLMM